MAITQLEKNSILNAVVASSWSITESCTKNGNRLNNKNCDTTCNIFRSVVLHHCHSWKGVAKAGITPRKYKNQSYIWPLEDLQGKNRRVE